MRRSCCWCGGRCTCTWTSRRFAESINQCLAALLSSGPRLGPVPECHSRHYQPCDRQRHAACNVNGTRCNGAMQCAWRAKWGGAAGLYTGLPSQSPHDEKLLKTHPYTRARLFWTAPIFKRDDSRSACPPADTDRRLTPTDETDGRYQPMGPAVPVPVPRAPAPTAPPAITGPRSSHGTSLNISNALIRGAVHGALERRVCASPRAAPAPAVTAIDNNETSARHLLLANVDRYPPSRLSNPPARP